MSVCEKPPSGFDPGGGSLFRLIAPVLFQLVDLLTQFLEYPLFQPGNI